MINRLYLKLWAQFNQYGLSSVSVTETMPSESKVVEGSH